MPHRTRQPPWTTHHNAAYRDDRTAQHAVPEKRLRTHPDPGWGAQQSFYQQRYTHRSTSSLTPSDVEAELDHVPQ